jgi:hypothetical protein
MLNNKQGREENKRRKKNETMKRPIFGYLVF